MNASDEDAYHKYKTALEEDLTQNLKPVITALSYLAEDYKQNSFAIVRSIEDYIKQIPSELKYLGLYLIDSIIKNHKYTTDYIRVFDTRILELFVYVFESVGERDRKKLYQLRATWNEYFTHRVLYDLDVRIKRIDPAWPIMPATMPTTSNGSSSSSLASSSSSALASSTTIVSRPASNTEIKPLPQPLAPRIITPTINSNTAVTTTTTTATTATTATARPESCSKRPAAPINDEARTSKEEVRDPRIRQPINKPKQSVAAADQPRLKINEANIFEPKPTSTSKSSPQKHKTTINKSPSSIMNGLKRTSPTNNLSSGEIIKKPKLNQVNKSPTTTILGATSKPSTIKTINTKPIKQPSTTLTTTATNKLVSKPNKSVNSNENVTKNSEEIKEKPNNTQTNRKLVKNKPDLENKNNTKPLTTNGSAKPSTITEPAKASSSPRKLISLLEVPLVKPSKPITKPNPVKSIAKPVVDNKPDVSEVATPKISNKEHQNIVVSDALVSFNDVDERMGDVDDRTKHLQGQATFPSLKLNELNALISESASKGSAKDFLANLLKVSQSSQSLANKKQTVMEIGESEPLSDKLLQDRENSLNELQRQLSISQSNDAASMDKVVSKNTQDLLETIGTILEMTKKKMITEQQRSTTPDICLPSDIPPIKARDRTENHSDSLLIIDGRSYRIQPEVVRLIKVYYHDHELFCDTRTKDVFIDKKRVYRMGESTKEVTLNGRKVRLMYNGRRIELWLDGISFHFRVDSPPKLISLTSSITQQVKRYYVTIDSRTMDMFFNNYKVCRVQPAVDPQAPQTPSNTLMCQLAPDDYEPHEISFVCPPKRIQIDGIPRTMRYDLAVPCIEMDAGQLYIIRFSGPPRDIYIDDIPYLVPFDKTVRIKLNGRAHEVAWGGPGFEVIVDGRPFELQFNKPKREVIIGTRQYSVFICGDAPDVKICGQLPPELQQVRYKQEKELEKNELQSKTGSHLPSLMNFEIPPPVAKPMDVNDLVKKLTDKGLLSMAKDKETTEMAAEKTVKQAANSVEKVPDLTSFDTDLLKQKYQGAIQSLYSGVQCATCGNRFNQTTENGVSSSSRYSKHLDWHFRQNTKEKDEVNKAHSRAWYYILMEWIQYEELSEDLPQQQQVEAMVTNEQPGPELGNTNIMLPPNSVGTNPLLILADHHEYSSDDNAGDENNLLDDLSMNNGRGKEPNKGSSATTDSGFMGSTSCPASDDIDDKCWICKDFFEIFFYQEREEWHFKDAIRVENKVYHPICLEDAREDTNNSLTMPNLSLSNSNFNSSMNSDDATTASSVIVKKELKEMDSEEINNQNNNSCDSTAFYTARETNNSQDDSMNITNTTVEMMLMGGDDDNQQASQTVSMIGSLVSDAYEDESCKDEPKTP